ncbi:NAD(P)/FAD-dependent oxidoreductase [Mycobacterium sp. E2733]|uniref:NAD(P)/FAD-dependent oxidoreductase n=1 Tax=Mycobacterium sp. E2733 TaxID=1834138 RepID=UPI0007FE1DBC|nr:FAD-dependent oxidoreductase [Mycobacterium sp. E2733]OBH97699.1 thioredoxin reductase [Mycobacterium sp. E2733]
MRSAGWVRDVIIVGSGPAGYTAAIYTARAGLDTIVVEGEVPGGALTAAGPVDNYPGATPFVYGPALAIAMRDQAQRFGAELHPGDVERFGLDGDVKTVAVRDELHHARAIVLAMGSINRPLNVPGERDFSGRGLSTSAKLDGAQFTGCEVAVIGGGDAAAEEALYLASRARHVTLVHHRPRLRASAIAVARLRAHPNVTILTSTEVLAVQGEHHVTGLRMRNTHNPGDYDIDVAAVFVAVGQMPRSDLLKGLIDLDPNGYVQTRDHTKHTSIEGVFAAGDLIDRRYRQAITAAATGCAAALDAERWITSRNFPS